MTNKNEKFVHFTWRFYLITPSENPKSLICQEMVSKNVITF